MAAILADRMVAITGEHVPLVQARGSRAVARCRFPAAAGAIAAMTARLDGDRWQRIAEQVGPYDGDAVPVAVTTYSAQVRRGDRYRAIARYWRDMAEQVTYATRSPTIRRLVDRVPETRARALRQIAPTSPVWDEAQDAEWVQREAEVDDDYATGRYTRYEDGDAFLRSPTAPTVDLDPAHRAYLARAVDQIEAVLPLIEAADEKGRA